MAVSLHGQQAGNLAAGTVTGTHLASATVANANMVAGTLTPAKLAATPFKVLKAAGVAAAGPITLTGTAVGDRVVMVFGAPTAGGALVEAAASFEAVVTVINQIQQSSASNLSANTYVYVLMAAAA